MDKGLDFKNSEEIEGEFLVASKENQMDKYSGFLSSSKGQVGDSRSLHQYSEDKSMYNLNVSHMGQ